MAAVFTLTQSAKGTLGRGMFAVFDFTSDGGTYTTDGIAPVLPFASYSRYRRQPDIVLFDPNNGYVYSYDYSNLKILIHAQTNLPAEDAPLGQLTNGVAVPAAARLGCKVLALWFAPVP